MVTETWAEIAGYASRYSVSNLGRVRTNVAAGSKTAGDLMGGHFSKPGFRIVNLTRPDGSQHNESVHRLVAQAFCPEIGSHKIDFRDGNKLNCAVSNLKLVDAILEQTRVDTMPDGDWRVVVAESGLGRDYRVSSKGEFVRLFRYGRVIRPLKVRPHPSGYVIVTLSRKGESKAFLAHRLVAQTFLPNPEGKEQVNHKDGDKVHNAVPNLEWSTQVENMQHCSNELQHLRWKPTPKEMLEIIREVHSVAQALARKYGTSAKLVLRAAARV